MKSQLKKQLQDKELQQEVQPKVIRISTDQQLYEKLMHKRPARSGSGDRKFPGYDGLWGEFIESQRKWTDGRWFVSAVRGFPKTGRMSFAKAWTIRCMRMGLLR